MIRAIVKSRDGAPHQILRVWQRAIAAAFSSKPFSSPACSATTSADALEYQHPYGNGRFFPWSASQDVAAASSDLGINFGIALQTADSNSFLSICPESLVERDLLEIGNQFSDCCRLCGSNFGKLENNHDSRCTLNILYRFHRPENAVDLPASHWGDFKQHLDRGKLVQQHVKDFENEKSYKTMEVGQIKFVLPELEQHGYPLEASSVKRKRKKKMNKHKQRKLRRRDRHRK